MAQPNRISVIIPQAEHDQIMQHLAAVRTLLTPYLVQLTDDERKSLPKMGDKSQPFVEKALNYAETNPAYVAPSVSIAEWKKDFDAWEDLTPINNQLEQLSSDVDGTVMVLGSECLDPARWYYGLVDMAADRGDLTAKPIYEDLAQRFKRASYKKKDENK